MNYNWDIIKNQLKVEVLRSGKFKYISQVADYLGISVSTVREAFKSGKIVFSDVVGEDMPKPVVSKINIINKPNNYFWSKQENTKRILFITDLQVGYVTNENGKINPIHDIQFISNMIEVAKYEEPDEIVWGGDLLDLADFSTFNNGPSVIGNLQISLFEINYILNVFSNLTNKQIYIEGNHEERLSRFLNKSMPSLVGVYNPSGQSKFPIVSVPNMIGIETIKNIEWFGGYPNNVYDYNERICFIHGSSARPGGGSTVSSLIKGFTKSVFFGHIHRMELTKKRNSMNGDIIWSGSPGCGCRVGFTPGSTIGSDWHLGAFLITVKDEDISNIDLFSQNELTGELFNKRMNFSSELYISDFEKSIPEKYRGIIEY